MCTETFGLLHLLYDFFETINNDVISQPNQKVLPVIMYISPTCFNYFRSRSIIFEQLLLLQNPSITNTVHFDTVIISIKVHCS